MPLRFFQRKMVETLVGLEGTEVYMDDILIHGETEEIHNQHLVEAVRVTEVAGLKLNKAKCKFKLKQVRCLGNIIDEINVRPDPDKVAEIVNFPQPNNVIKLEVPRDNQLSGKICSRAFYSAPATF